MNTILEDVRKVIGGGLIDHYFDEQICMHINTEIFTLDQLGVVINHVVVNDETKWTEVIPDIKEFEAIKTWLGLKVRLIFDPPTSSYVMESITSNLNELEFRIQTKADELDKGVIKEDDNGQQYIKWLIER